MKRIVYSRDAARFLDRAPSNVARLIQSKCEVYAADPSSLRNNVKVLKGERGYLRLRIGDWRVVFNESKDLMMIVRIASRGSVYD